MAKFIYEYVYTVEGKICCDRYAEASFELAMDIRGHKVVGFNSNKWNREELQGQPVFNNLCGPMWGGDEIGGVVIRYEDSEANEIFSR